MFARESTEADSAHLDASADAGGDFRRWRVLEADLKEVVMSANTKVSALDHAMHDAHTWVNDVAKEFDDTDDGSSPVGCCGRGCIPCGIGSSRQARTFAAQLPDLIRGVFYAGCNPSAVADKYDAEAYALRFAREANIALQDVGKAAAATTAALLHFLPPAQMHKALDQLPSEIRVLLQPCGHLGRARDDEFITGRVIAGSEHLSCERLVSATTFREHRELD